MRKNMRKNYLENTKVIVLGKQISIYDECISQALKKLPSKKRILFLIMILPGKAAPVLRDGMIPMRLLPASRLQE